MAMRKLRKVTKPSNARKTHDKAAVKRRKAVESSSRATKRAGKTLDSKTSSAGSKANARKTRNKAIGKAVDAMDRESRVARRRVKGLTGAAKKSGTKKKR